MKEPRFSRRSESGGDRVEGPTGQQRWEEQQITKGVIEYGSKDRKGRLKGEEKEYELLMEDKIDFVLADLNPGNLGEKKKEVSLIGCEEMCFIELRKISNMLRYLSIVLCISMKCSELGALH